MRIRSKDLDGYVGKFPMWIEYHMDTLRGKLAGMEKTRAYSPGDFDAC